MLPSPRVAEADASCRHCGSPVSSPASSSDERFCCRGCAEVYRLLHDAGLDRYYALGGGEGHPVERAAEADHKWLEPFVAQVAGAAGESESGLRRIVLDVQGIHCSACVWLFETIFGRAPGAARILVNPARGTVELTVGPGFPLARFVTDIEAFGYRFGPPLKEAASAGRADPTGLVWRMGVCIAIAMNTMIFGVAIYCGLSSGPVYRLFHALDFTLSFVSVLVGGTVFFRSAWQALRQRVLHLDLPIALGIVLVFASSSYTYAIRGGTSSYFDTLNVFIALMLVGRFLQERVLSKNRAMLLASNGAEGIFTRRASNRGVETIRCSEVAEGDVLLLARGDIVPVDAELLEADPALFSLDWISGESAPRSFTAGATIPAGAFSHGPRAVRVRSLSAFESSRLVSLLQQSSRRDDDLPRATAWHRRLTRVYVASVLTIAAAAFAGWLLATHDLARTLDVVAAILIVTCPCAFGIATPLAYELAQGGLRRLGLFVRTPGFLDRAAEVTRVVFDKTGTLTTGRLVVRDQTPLLALSWLERDVLRSLVVRSSHPKSRAIADALGEGDFSPEAVVEECPGKGLERRVNGRIYRVGARAWAVAPAKIPRLSRAAGDVVFSCDGVILAAITTTEELRADAQAEVAALAGAGYDTFVLSGDTTEATQAMAERCGIAPDHAFGARNPEEKAQWMRARSPANTLFVGDGINDSLVAEEASCAGTPAIDRPFMAARSDFYFVTPGLRPIRMALLAARTLARTVQRNLLVALFYNAITVSLALAGLMTPLLCAILMPVSSLSTVLATTYQLAPSRIVGRARKET